MPEGQILLSPIPCEVAGRRDLREQIARLEGDLARTLAEVFPRREPARGGRPASAQAGPRLLTLEQLECIRDELADRVQTLRSPPGRAVLERMRRTPERQRGATVTSAELGEPGCRVWRVRQRHGPIGRLMGWWRVKVASGCPLPR